MNGELKPFERGTLNLPPFDVFVARVRADASFAASVTDDELRRQYDALQADDIWMNDEYQVNIRHNVPNGFPNTEITHLSIKRLGKQPIHDWRDLQAIKNMLVSPYAEAMELYPSVTRTVDGSNQYHLWVVMRVDDAIYPELPVGFSSGRCVTNQPMRNGKQRKLHKGGASL